MLMKRIILRKYGTLSNPKLLDNISTTIYLESNFPRDNSGGSFPTFNSSEIVWYFGDPSNSNTGIGDLFYMLQ
jgi:hypothetical protein